MDEHDELLFNGNDDAETEKAASTVTEYWKLLIIDDEPEVHTITELALVDFFFENKGIEFLHAYSAQEAFSIIKSTPDIAIALLDVVMETDHAGLDLIQQIREGIGNRLIRIILRTGQAGIAPERDIVTNYDINDYTEKAGLTAQKLFTILVASLRAYRDILKLEKSGKELLQANQHLAQERKRIQITLDSIGDAVLTTDAEGMVTHMNPVAETLTGWTISEARNKPLTTIFNIVNADTLLPVENPVNKALTTGKTTALVNHTVLISKDGTVYHIADSAAPIRNESGETIGVILVCRDVTRECQVEEALRRSQKMEAIGQLSGGIAHDFNNQLGIILGYLDFLKEGTDNGSEPAKWIDITISAALRCTDLTQQLLSFARTQTKEKTVVDINAKLTEMETMLTRSVTPEVNVQYFLADDLWPTALDPGGFQDAILNLVINARDAMPDGGKLLIETGNKFLDYDYAELNPGVEPGDYVQLTLSDTGSGMDRATREHIFEPFFTTKAKGKGTGLGLAMVYGFTKRCNGYIKVYSEPGVGTTIRMYLPRSSTTADRLVVDDMIPRPVLPMGSESILIVDDEVALLQLANRYLSDLGYSTRTAESGAQALAVLSEDEDIDLLFSDVVMPGGMNGYELAQQATERQPAIKVLLTSGFTSKTIAHNGLARFSTHLLGKPYLKTDLAQRIRTVLEE